MAIDGQDHRDLSLESIRHAVTLVRDFEVFTGSIRDNLQVGRQEFGHHEILDALKQVGLLGAVRALPDGLDTQLATGGRPFSQGQIARLMLARALLSRPRLLLIDRALDVLDRRAREQIGDMLFADDAPWTLVMISEREDLLKRCSRRVSLASDDLKGPGPAGGDAERSISPVASVGSAGER